MLHYTLFQRNFKDFQKGFVKFRLIASGTWNSGTLVIPYAPYFSKQNIKIVIYFSFSNKPMNHGKEFIS